MVFITNNIFVQISIFRTNSYFKSGSSMNLDTFPPLTTAGHHHALCKHFSYADFPLLTVDHITIWDNVCTPGKSRTCFPGSSPSPLFSKVSNYGLNLPRLFIRLPTVFLTFVARTKSQQRRKSAWDMQRLFIDTDREMKCLERQELNSTELKAVTWKRETDNKDVWVYAII